MIPQIPYAAIGIGIAIIFGVWAFLVAETVKQRAIIAVMAVVIFLVPVIIRSAAGKLISLIGWVIFGIGCIVYLRYNGIGIR